MADTKTMDAERLRRAVVRLGYELRVPGNEAFDPFPRIAEAYDDDDADAGPDYPDEPPYGVGRHPDEGRMALDRYSDGAGHRQAPVRPRRAGAAE